MTLELRLGTSADVDAAGRITGYATDIGFFGHAVGERMTLMSLGECREPQGGFLPSILH